MIKIILSLFTIYQLSLGNRLLLQGGVPQFIPIVPTTVAPVVTPAATAPANPVETAPANPVVTPFVPPTVTAVQPIQPPAPPAPPSVTAFVPPTMPGVPGVPAVTAFTPPAWQQVAAPPKLECIESAPHKASCAGQIKTINNPSMNFELLCKGYAACAGTTININLNQYALMNVQEPVLKGFWFTADYAGAGATININNQRPGNKVQIEEIKCDKLGACYNTQFIIGDRIEIEVGDFFCGPMGQGCLGCRVKESPTDPGYPCSAFVEPI